MKDVTESWKNDPVNIAMEKARKDPCTKGWREIYIDGIKPGPDDMVECSLDSNARTSVIRVVGKRDKDAVFPEILNKSRVRVP